MNILLLTAAWHPPVSGGVKANARTLVSALTAQHSVSVFVSNWSHKSPVEMMDENGIPVIKRRVRAPFSTHKPLRTFVGWLLDFPAFLWQLRKICRDRRIDVIHIQQGNPSWLNVALADFIGIPPYTVGLHGGELRAHAESGFLSRRCFDFIITHSSAVIAVSNAVAIRGRDLFPGLAAIAVIPNGVREMELGHGEGDARRTIEGLRLPGEFFLCVGSLLLIKGHDVAIRAWRYVLETRPDCHLVIVGDGERRSHLERLIRDCECEGRIHLLGGQTPRTIHGLMSIARGMVHPSRYESLGIVLLEAGLAGCPVVATRVGGIPEVIEDERSGLLVEPENEPELAAAVLRILEDRALAERIAANLASRVRSDFTASAMAEKYASLFVEVVERRTRQSRNW